MSKLLIGFLSTLVIVVGGYFGYQEFVEAQPEKTEEVSKEVEEETVEKEIVSLKEDEVKKIIETNLDSIYNTLLESGKENGWSPSNPVKYEDVKTELLPYITNNFADTTMKEYVEQFYCDCDASSKPELDYDVRFSFEQKNNDELTVTSLVPANELNNMGNSLVFNFVKEENNWKLNEWEYIYLDGENIELTKDEAETILARNNEVPEFIEEYESEEASGKAYLFNVKSENGERLVAISSKDTKLVNDYSYEKESESATSNDKETVTLTNLYEEYYEKLNFGMTKEDMVNNYGQPVSEKELSDAITLEYSDAIYTLSKVSNQVYKVNIIGEKTSNFYANFDEVMKAYFPDPVYAEYMDEKFSDDNGYHLKLDDGYSKSHTFTSKSENGDPINLITIEVKDFK